VVLSRTQRKTPTVIHPGYQISRIRSFYMRKVKFTQQNYEEKLDYIVLEFPKLDDIHPFYADLMNVLYDRDHYKLALGHCNTAKAMIKKISDDYIRLLKYGDSLYRCKMLKRAALGRMCTFMRKMKSSLEYLEEVRKHLSRLPSIDPNARTLMVCGYPNVGKSSFMNKVTRADVEVQPYAFTTKSLFVGHMDYKYLRWQVIDTPGILDHPLEERNTIEMQSITALAHLHSAILYFCDISEQCGYTMPEQIQLFKNIKPLFSNKPLILVINKCDIVPWDSVPAETKAMIADAAADTTVMHMSNHSEEGIGAVKTTACDRLLEQRVDIKLRGKKTDSVLNRLHLAQPTARDAKTRPANIPAAAKSGEKKFGKLMRDHEDAAGGAGKFAFDMQSEWKLQNQEWATDIVPEIMDGKNIADFIDPDIMERLKELEREEELLESRVEMESEDELDEGDHEMLQAIRDKKKMIRHTNRLRRARNSTAIPAGQKKKAHPNTIEDLGEHLRGRGMRPDEAEAVTVKVRSRSRERPAREGRKRQRDSTEDMEVDCMDDGDGGQLVARSRSKSQGPGARPRSESIARGRSLTPAPGEGFKNAKEKELSIKKADRAQKQMSKKARKGEADRHVPDLKPKHLYSGKMSKGTRDWR
jgi:nucleolar GTP-binding protein